MAKRAKIFERVLVQAAKSGWVVFDKLNSISPNPSFTPRWSDKPLLKSYQKEKPPLGWPRTTDSLCPKCIPEIRQQIVDGKLPHEILLNEKVGEIKAQIIERDGKILMVKDCPVHGHFEDVMSIDPPMMQHLEDVFPGRDIRAHNDEKLHNHGTSTVTHGRGSVLTIDLTNRCNMMCDPCFMDANQVGFVHELTWDEIKTMLDNAITIKPRRQMSVQFSGGEPTLSPYFLDAVAYSRKVGYNSVQAATNGIEFAKSKEFAKAAAEAGLRYAYLQFDGIGNAANSHRKVGNAFDVKLQAIHNLHEAGVDIVPVTTIVNGINNEQVGRIIQFALDNPKKINFLSFQPVSFTGRDEAVSDERREAQRYTLSHLAHDVRDQTGLGESTRDWFPISFMSTFSDWADLVHGPDRDWGQLSCGCHPNCGIGMALMIDKETKEAVPVTAFLKADQLAKDVARINDASRGKFLSILGVSLALLRNYEPAKAPTHFKIVDLLQKFDKCFGATGRDYGKVTADRTMDDIKKRRNDRWNFLFIAGMWFQDLFNYDFRRTEQCIIPYATQEGEISFCAYNTGVGWRNIIEKMHMTSTLTKWYEEHGRHEIFAGGKKVGIEKQEKYDLVLNEAHVNSAANDTFDKSGIAKNAREEKIRARDAKLKQDAENARMAKLYRKEVLQEPDLPGGFIALGDIKPAATPSPSRRNGSRRLNFAFGERRFAQNHELPLQQRRPPAMAAFALSSTSMKARARSIATASRALPVLVYYATVLKRPLTYGELGKLTEKHQRAFRAAFAQIDKWVEQSSALHGFEKLPLAIIVVQKGKSTPGAGAIRWRLKANKLSQNAHADVIEALFEHERKLIFSFKQWTTLLEDLNLPAYKPQIETIDSITAGLENRGAPTGESENHRRLKEFVGKNPTMIGLPRNTRLIGYEVVLPSLDRVDILFENSDTIFPVEIKSHEVDELEFTRGIYQAVKYQSLFQAQEMDRGRTVQVKATLVCGRQASDAEMLRCQLLNVSLCDSVKRT